MKGGPGPVGAVVVDETNVKLYSRICSSTLASVLAR